LIGNVSEEFLPISEEHIFGNVDTLLSDHHAAYLLIQITLYLF
jgi:hypothetical protein